MHRGHDHDHHHHHGGNHGHHGNHGGQHGGHHHPHPGTLGHNGPSSTAQWQTPHRPPDETAVQADPGAVDLDLVEAAFVEGFARAPDTASFLRLAGIPFVGETAGGRLLHLLRVETDDVVDVGAVMPLLGGAGVRYDPLPARLVSRRRRLGFLYHDGTEPRRLAFAEARALKDRSGPSRMEL